ncbi:hypothetical protein [Allobranchiibius sp. GilTou73]|nr:hypothetical protein [Allobranchiibius sp. GilTou73]UIJ34620.1 hypothetical protein LVQ62_16215 [Allobranchiibius sp. GilTou73]
MTALLVVRGGHTDGLDRPAFLDATCAALIEQTRPPTGWSSSTPPLTG